MPTRPRGRSNEKAPERIRTRCRAALTCIFRWSWSLLTIWRQSLSECHTYFRTFPSIGKRILAVMIAKREEDPKLPGTSRPISLFSNTSKVAEATTLHGRVLSWLRICFRLLRILPSQVFGELSTPRDITARVRQGSLLGPGSVTGLLKSDWTSRRIGCYVRLSQHRGLSATSKYTGTWMYLHWQSTLWWLPEEIWRELHGRRIRLYGTLGREIPTDLLLV